jgi:hypothetical protein
MERVAISHQRALKASRIKDNPPKMREEFLLAAKQYYPDMPDWVLNMLNK